MSTGGKTEQVGKSGKRLEGMNKRLKDYFGKKGKNVEPLAEATWYAPQWVKRLPTDRAIQEVKRMKGAASVDPRKIVEIDVEAELEEVHKTHKVQVGGGKLLGIKLPKGKIDTHIGTRDEHYAELLRSAQQFFTACKTKDVDIDMLLPPAEVLKQALIDFAEKLAGKEMKRGEEDPSRSKKLSRCNDLIRAISEIEKELLDSARQQHDLAVDVVAQKIAEDIRNGRPIDKATAKDFLLEFADCKQNSPQAVNRLLECFPALVGVLDVEEGKDVVGTIVKQLLDRDPPDLELLDRLCEELLTAEVAAAASDPTTFMRTDSPATRMVGVYGRGSPGGKQALSELCDNAHTRIKTAPPLEIDPDRFEEGGVPIEEAIEVHKQMARQTIDEMVAVDLPPEMNKIAFVFYDEIAQQTGDRQFALMKTLNLLFLRYVNPHLLSPENTFPGEENYELDPQQRRNAILQSKILQNIVNDAHDVKGKEEFMVPLNDLIRTETGEPSPEMVKLLQFAAKAIKAGGAQIGDERAERKEKRDRYERAKQIPLDKALQSRAITGALIDFCTKESEEQHVRYLFFYQSWLSKAPDRHGRDAFERFLNLAAPEKLDIDDSLRFEFAPYARKSEWSKAPWQKLYQTVFQRLEEEIYPRFVNSEEFAAIFD